MRRSASIRAVSSLTTSAPFIPLFPIAAGKRAWSHILYNHSAGRNHGPRPHLNSDQYHRTRTNMRALADPHAAAQHGARRNMGVIADAAIVLNHCAAVDQNIASNSDRW